MDICPCGSNLAFAECCEPLLKGARPAETAEQLMRSRYTAYVRKEIGYLRTTLHPDHRSDFNEKETLSWAEKSNWHGLEIVRTEAGGAGDNEGKVEFIATFSQRGARMKHHEVAEFKKEEGEWFLTGGETVAPQQVVRQTPKIGRNDPCACGSGKKYKKCCGQ
ncbi:MAG TPA: YchJ family protein [Dissulfurispiraceae bacterium]